MTKETLKQRIERSLRIFLGKGILVPSRDLKEFYIATKENNLNIWGDYSKFPKLIGEGRAGVLRLHFPARCPESWLVDEVQSSPFYILTEGASTPLGFESRIHKYSTLQDALNAIDRRRPELVSPDMYGSHALYLGRKVNEHFLFEPIKERK